MNLLFERTLSAFFIILSLGGCGSLQQGEIADLILKNTNVITVDPGMPRAEAIAVRGDRILAVGTNAEIQAFAGDATRVLSLEGATVVPGLIDAHIHFPRLGKRTKELFLDETRSAEEVVVILREQVKKRSAGEWVMGQGWHTATWNVLDYPDNTALNDVAPDNPVYLVGMASHAAWVNNTALRLAGVDKDTPDPPGGKIVRHADTGEPTGILLENATALVSRFLPEETRETRKADLELSVRTATRMGLTSLHDAGSDYQEIQLYKELLEEGKLDIRLYVMFDIPSPGAALEEYIKKPPEIGLGDNRLTLRSLKVYADGALGARGAVLLEPYSDQQETTGLVQNDESALYQIVSRAMKAGYQVSTHAIGDGGNRAFLNAVEKAQKELPGRDPRHRNEHSQVISPEDIPRFAELGVIASMQPIHCITDMGFAEKRLGPERMKGAYAWKSLLDAGATVVGGADTPAFPVHWTNPLLGIYAAVTRQDSEGNPPGGFYPEERVSRMEALKMYTISAAYAAFEEDIKGSLTVGKLADITVLSKDILSVPASEILETEALMTIVGGEIVFQQPGFPE
ncbi:MAG: amidohydrolase [Acidobacteriota bacterium]